MSANGEHPRRELLERYGRLYAEHGFAIIWATGKKVTTFDWQKTKPLASPEFAAGLFARAGRTRNPAVTARTSGLVLIDCDTPEGLAEIEALNRICLGY